jgi:hypothetical protein
VTGSGALQIQTRSGCRHDKDDPSWILQFNVVERGAPDMAKLSQRKVEPPTPAQLRLIEQTYAAFSRAPRPSINQMTSHRCGECDGIRDEFAKYRARDVPSHSINNNTAVLSLITPMALRYYMPRFVEYSIVPTFADSVIIDSLLYQLGPEKTHEPYWAERLSIFAEVERAAVANYIATRKTWPDGGYDGGYHDQFFDRAEIIWGVGKVVV